MKVGDLVRHRIGSISRIGIVVATGWRPACASWRGRDIEVHFFDSRRAVCSPRYLEVINESR